MSSVTFRYGTMESMKSLQLLADAYAKENKGKKILCIKPERDDRSEDITTRAGLSRKADIVLSPHDSNVYMHVWKYGGIKLDYVYVDEAQFLTYEQIMSLTDIADVMGVPVIAYGLLTDFQGKQFDGSKALIELADNREEIDNDCYYCKEKAILNARLKNGRAVFDGEQIQTGDTKDDAEMSYKPVCRKCFKRLKSGEILLRKK